jgi:hypothetical protein
MKTSELRQIIREEVRKALHEITDEEQELIKKEAIDRLYQFFRVPAHTLTKFKFDGTDSIKDLTRALNSTSDQGTKLYYDMAIKLAKKDLDID